MNAEQKAVAACARYVRLRMEIKRLTRGISNALSGCPGVEGRINEVWLETTEAHEDMTHVKRAYAGEVVVTGWEPYLRHYSDAELIEQLSVCPHCLAAHEAIQARKAARKSLGAAKRAITMIGRKAITA
jgi:hypothetical protein